MRVFKICPNNLRRHKKTEITEQNGIGYLSSYELELSKS